MNNENPTSEGSSQPKSVAPRSIGELLSSVFEQIPALIRGEIDYTIANAKAKGKEMGAGALALSIAGFMVTFAFILLICAAVVGLARIVPLWAAFLIVAGVFFVIAVIAGLIGARRLSQSKKYTVDPKAGVDRSVEAVRKGLEK